jgi:hypothetical protein
MTIEGLSRLPRNAAVISSCGRFRYLLTRHIGAGKTVATFIMLNPSTADAFFDDPTIRKCRGFARRWECGTLRVINLFAVRATDPAAVRLAHDPVGPENMNWVNLVVSASVAEPHRLGPVVCAWGINGTFMDQDVSMFSQLNCLGILPAALGVTTHGHPRHPLYVPYSAKLMPYCGRTADDGRMMSRQSLRTGKLEPRRRA